MSTRVQHVELLDTVLHGRIAALGAEIRRAQPFSPLKVQLRTEKAALLGVRAGEIPDAALPTVRRVVAHRLASLAQSRRRAENPHFKEQLREEFAELIALNRQLGEAAPREQA